MVRFDILVRSLIYHCLVGLLYRYRLPDGVRHAFTPPPPPPCHHTCLPPSPTFTPTLLLFFPLYLHLFVLPCYLGGWSSSGLVYRDAGDIYYSSLHVPAHHPNYCTLLRFCLHLLPTVCDIFGVFLFIPACLLLLFSAFG